MHIDFALPIDGDLATGFARYQQAAAKSVMDYSFHMAVTSWDDKASPIDRADVPGANGAEDAIRKPHVMPYNNKALQCESKACLCHLAMMLRTSRTQYRELMSHLLNMLILRVTPSLHCSHSEDLNLRGTSSYKYIMII